MQAGVLDLSFYIILIPLGMVHFVATDFNPFKKGFPFLQSSIGRVHIYRFLYVSNRWFFCNRIYSNWIKIQPYNIGRAYGSLP
ncbi:hypothetical protein B0A80_15695 [Flavobacterium tructae]|nr:hypothetical protein B0A80_15695 [Flavobacterium tructae]